MIRILALLIALLLPVQSWAGQTQLGSTDTFNGTNTNTLTTYNAGWILSGSATVNHCQILGTPGAGAASNLCGAHDTRQTWTDDHWGEVLVDATNLAANKFMISLRLTVDGANKPNGYVCGFSSSVNNKYRIGKYVAGAFSSIAASTTNDYTLGDTLNCQVTGSSPVTVTLTITRGGSVVETLSTSADSTYTSGGNPGLIFQNTTSVRLGGTWKAGSVTATIAPPSSSFPFTVIIK